MQKICGAISKGAGAGVEAREGSVVLCSDCEKRSDEERHPYEHHSSYGRHEEDRPEEAQRRGGRGRALQFIRAP